MCALKLRDCKFQISYGPSDDRLNGFYIPALSSSVRYDRSAGFFTSTALAVAAAGVARLVANGGTMRLLVGAALSEDDVRAVEQGQALSKVLAERLVAALSEPAEAVMRRRLEVLAWMIASGTLEIRVVLPKGPDGRPLPAPQAQDYFHAKEGLFTDSSGDQIAFSGSVNESETAWLRNYEQFSVYFSWDATAPYLAQVRYRFERLWNDQEPDWIALDVPDAVRQHLLTFRPPQPPVRDALERQVPPPEVKPKITEAEQSERVLFQFLRDAPHLLGAESLGAATGAVTPWPHQARIASDVVARFPERFLLCDEVGLGKTIEAGLVVRQLVLSGWVRRCLILAPKSVCRQWQEELYEKFALNVPFFDGHTFRDVFGEERIPEAPNPWDAEDIYIASSQLAKRRERQPELLAARPWDLVLVDEAHHARRRDFLSNRYRPNRLLELLMGREDQAGLKDRTLGLLMMTATPMQVHPVEVWDLLRVLGLGGRWGAYDGNFLRFFQELRKPVDDADWDFVFGMVDDFLKTGGQMDSAFAHQAEAKLGLVDWKQVRGLPSARDRKKTLLRLPPKARALAVQMARRHTPLQRYMFRSTRRLLREYTKRGILKDNVPTRDPRPIWIAMREDEENLYARIEEYITEFYQKYEGERKGLGFVMTVYRRRLTSSFYAVRRSLERRLAFLRGLAVPGTLAGMDEDDLEQEELAADITETLDAEERTFFQDEVEYVQDFLTELGHLSGNDSKVERLLADLDELFKKRDKVLVFTQYTDTMDFLREQLRHVYGSQVACYSGRGGEVWNGIAWIQVSKEEIKNAFREGETIKILLCTEAASEGLNLQTCGVLINYDMPWNPMRVEQRIGRIDRIGQVYKQVWLRHYFYEGTVEAKVYRALEDRIGWFVEVVGELQPILSRVGQTIQTVAMTPAARREQVLADELARLREEMETQRTESLNLDQYIEAGDVLGGSQPPVTLGDLENVLTRSSCFKERFKAHPELEHSYWLQMDEGDRAVTFDAAAFDAHPNTLRLLTYGDVLFAEMLECAPQPGPQPDGRILRCEAGGTPAVCAYYALDKSGKPRRLLHLADLESALSGRQTVPAWTEERINAARVDFEREYQDILGRHADILAARRRAERLALQEQGRRTLVQAALVDLAMAQQSGMFSDDAMPASFTEDAVANLKRHGYPFAPLLRLVSTEGLRPTPDDPFFGRIAGQPDETLKGHLLALRQRAERLVALLAQAGDGEKSASAPVPQVVVKTL